MLDTVEIRVNGRKFKDWESITINRSIDKNAGSYSFGSSSLAPAEYPLRAGNAVQVVVNTTSLARGFIDSVRGSGSQNQGQGITLTGRDNTQDLIDSSVPDAAKSIEGPISLVELCERVIDAIGADIPVASLVVIDDFDEFQNFVADSGRNCMDFLVSFARKRNVYLVTNGAGGLIIFRPDLRPSDTAILNEKDGLNNNVVKWSITINHQDRFNTYAVRSQDNFGFNEFADYAGDGVERSGLAIDDQIRKSRYFEIQTPESSDQKEVSQTSIELANLRIANAMEYICTIPGLSQNNGQVWNFGQLVNVRDDFAGIRGVFMIKSVEYSINLGSGSFVSLTLVTPESYQVRLPTEKDNRIASRSTILQRDTPERGQVFIRS